MRVGYAPQHHRPCIVADEGETADVIMDKADFEGATCKGKAGEQLYVVLFPGRFPELYTEEALERNLPIEKGDSVLDHRWPSNRGSQTGVEEYDLQVKSLVKFEVL